jgi:hypothetical protein
MFNINDIVITNSALEPRDFLPECQAERKTSTIGIITGLSHGHGICFKVQHKHSTAYYDPDELTLVLRPKPRLNK